MSDAETLGGARTEEDKRRDVRHSIVQQMLSNDRQDTDEMLRSAAKLEAYVFREEANRFLSGADFYAIPKEKREGSIWEAFAGTLPPITKAQMIEALAVIPDDAIIDHYMVAVKR